jgi:hypothetical protein
MQVDYLIKPFQNMTQFISAMQIVNATFCIKKKNFDQVTEIINKVIGTDIPNQLISQFIEKLTVYPSKFGFEFFQNHQTLNNKLKNLCTTAGRASHVLNCNISNCIFCPKSAQSVLVIKNFVLTKEPILYTDNSIGKDGLQKKI